MEFQISVGTLKLVQASAFVRAGVRRQRPKIFSPGHSSRSAPAHPPAPTTSSFHTGTQTSARLQDMHTVLILPTPRGVSLRYKRCSSCVPGRGVLATICPHLALHCDHDGPRAAHVPAADRHKGQPGSRGCTRVQSCHIRGMRGAGRPVVKMDLPSPERSAAPPAHACRTCNIASIHARNVRMRAVPLPVLVQVDALPRA